MTVFLVVHLPTGEIMISQPSDIASTCTVTFISYVPSPALPDCYLALKQSVQGRVGSDSAVPNQGRPAGCYLLCGQVES